MENLHLFGVGVGSYAIKTKFSFILLRVTGLLFALYGTYMLFNLL